MEVDRVAGCFLQFFRIEYLVFVHDTVKQPHIPGGLAVGQMAEHAEQGGDADPAGHQYNGAV